jgi:hypothetical protein
LTTAGVETDFGHSAGLANFWGITAGPDNNMWFGAGGAIGQITTSGVISSFAVPGGNSVFAITAGPDGALWFTENGGNKIGRIMSCDGKSDITWRDTGGNVAVWLMNGAAVSSSGGFGVVPTTWSIVGQRDFDGDGKADWLWRDTSGNTAMWFMDGAQVSSSAGLGNIPIN